MNREDNLKRIRKEYPDYVVERSFVHEDLEIFTLGWGRKTIGPDSTAFFVAVDGNGETSLFDYWIKATPDLLKDENKTTRYIDIEGFRDKE